MRGAQLVEGPLLPLVLRGLLLAAMTILLTAGRGADAAFTPALAFVIVIAFSAIPLPGPAARMIQTFAEITVVGMLIGSNADIRIFAPLLLIPVFTAGQRGGLSLGAAGGFAGGLSWSLGVLSSPAETLSVAARLSDPLVWTIILVATGAIGGWVRRLTLQNKTFSDNAYEDAFRLLTELHGVARNLSLGLDPTTLAANLVDEVRMVIPLGEGSVSVQTGEGRRAVLVGADSGVLTDPTSSSAWSTGAHTSHPGQDGRERHAFPIRMGSQVIAVLDLRAGRLSSTDVHHVEQLVAEIGPKIAAALVFDDVRQLATVDERLRLAREIHDGVAQELASVGYLLDDVASRVPADAAQELHELRAHVRRVVGELRLSIFDLRAGADDSIGLGTALSEHVQRVGQQTEIVVHTVLDEHGGRLPSSTEVELLRIAQEAVTNVRKHAHAGNMWVECTVDAPRAWLRIADDGIGLQPAGPQSMGLRGMRERARRIGGDLTVGPRPGGGTVVEISIGDWDEEMETP